MRSPLRRLSALTTLALLALAEPSQAAPAGGPRIILGGESPAMALRNRIEQVLRRPEVYLASTTPTAQLLTAGNRLEAVIAPTSNVVPELVRMIGGAKREILLQTYEWDSRDEAAKTVFAALQERVERALASNDELLVVRVIVSHAYLSENGIKQDDLRGLIERVRTEPRAAGRVELELSEYRGALLSILHTKTLSIDGQKALVMTGNLYTHGGIKEDSFNAAMRVSGPVVDTLRRDWLGARALATRVAVSIEGDIAEDNRTSTAALAPSDARAQSGAWAAVLSRQSSWKPWATGENNPQDAGIIALLDGAVATVDIVNPSLGIKSVQDALIRVMRERNVEVRVLLSFEMNRWREHNLFGGDNFDHVTKLYARLLKDGGEALAGRLHVRWGSVDGETPGEVHSPGNIHAKVINIDDACLVLGSTNLNRLSWNNSRELSVAMIDDGIADPYRRFIFEPLWASSAPLRPEQLSLHASSNTGWPFGGGARPDEVIGYLRRRAVRERDERLAPPVIRQPPRLGYPARPRA